MPNSDDLDWVEETTWFEERKNPVKERNDCEIVNWLAEFPFRNHQLVIEHFPEDAGDYHPTTAYRMAANVAMDAEENDGA